MAELTAEQRVKAKWPDAYLRSEIYEDSVRTLRIFTVYRPQPGHEKDCCKRLSSGWSTSGAEAWSDAAQRLEHAASRIESKEAQ